MKKNQRERESPSWWQTLSLTFVRPSKNKYKGGGGSRRIVVYKGGIPATHTLTDRSRQLATERKGPPLLLLSSLVCQKKKKCLGDRREPNWWALSLLVLRSARLFAISFIRCTANITGEEEQEQDLFLVLFANCCQLWFIGLKNVFLLGTDFGGLKFSVTGEIRSRPWFFKGGNSRGLGGPPTITSVKKWPS